MVGLIPSKARHRSEEDSSGCCCSDDDEGGGGGEHCDENKGDLLYSC